MKKILLLAVLTCLYASVYSQHYTDKWYFGVLAGMDFTSGAPVAITSGALNTTEGCSSMSDSSGNILFYTNGVSVWNKNNQVMPNGDSLMGGVSSTQSALIVPIPGSNTQYYIFTVDEVGGANGFRYSIVDMTLQLATGDVTVKNIPILNNVTEKLTAVKQSNGPNYWIAVHEWGTDAFYVYRLTSLGLQPPPVISHTGIVHSNAQIQNTYGQMKFNPCGKKLALATGYLDTVEIFNFDDVTGIVSNPVTLPIGAHVYGIEFSQNSNYLYVSSYDPAQTLIQFNITSGNATTILASLTSLSITPDIYGLQLGIDGKIYVSRSFNQYLGVVNNPNLNGTSCNYVDNGVDLDPLFNGITSGLGLPGYVQSVLQGELGCLTSGVYENIKTGNDYSVFPNPSTGEFTVMFSDVHRFSSMTVFDQTGRKVEQFNSGALASTFSFGKSLDPGIYFVCLECESGVKYLSLIKY